MKIDTRVMSKESEEEIVLDGGEQGLQKRDICVISLFELESTLL